MLSSAVEMPKELILVVEDTVDIAEILEYHLERDRFEVEIPSRDDQALEALRRRNPDLVPPDPMLRSGGRAKRRR